MNSKKNQMEKEIKEFLGDIRSNKEAWKEIKEKFSGKVVKINHPSGLFVTGKFHSLTSMLVDVFINLTEVQENNCSPNVLNYLGYYHPRNYKKEKGKMNFGFVDASFDEDPEKTDLLLVPIAKGCTLECDGEVLPLPKSKLSSTTVTIVAIL